jgi:hypothetical protein
LQLDQDEVTLIHQFDTARQRSSSTHGSISDARPGQLDGQVAKVSLRGHEPGDGTPQDAGLHRGWKFEQGGAVQPDDFILPTGHHRRLGGVQHCIEHLSLTAHHLSGMGSTS